MDINEINSIIDKLLIYIDEERITFDDINNLFININYNYKTNNSNKIDLLSSELINNLNTILKIHENYLVVLEKNRDKALESEKKALEIIENIKNIY